MSEITEIDIKIAKKNGVDRANLTNRVKNLFWDVERARTTPVRKRGNFSKLYDDEIRKIAFENGISKTTLYTRIVKKGMTAYQAAQTITKGTKIKALKL